MTILTRLVLVALTVALSSCSEAMLNSESNGRQIPASYPLMVTRDANPAVLGDVATGQPKLVNSELPAEFEMVRADPNCRMPRPAQGAKLAYVYTYGGGEKTPLQYVPGTSNAASLQADIKRSRTIAGTFAGENPESSALASEAAAFARGNAVEWLSRIDVLVTETEAPVFLVLTSYDAVLWNIQTAPGVEIDGIVVSAYEGGAIANGVDARRTGFMGFRGAPSGKCYLKGAAYQTLTPAFQQSMHKRFGRKASWLLTEPPGTGVKAVLIGDVPDQPFQQQPITTIQLPSYVWPYWGSRDDAFKYFGLKG
jgi:hypothetical protein